MTENMKLWNSVCKTDPKVVKTFKGKGGFRGTTPCAQSQRKRMTEVFGPVGMGWWVSDETYEIIERSDDFHDKLLVYRGVLHYDGVVVLDDASNDCNFTLASCIDVWNYSSKGEYWSANNDIYKKVKTDALTKGLSELGFNSDIFEGKFDDNKYVQQMAEEFAEPPPPKEDVDMVKFKGEKSVAWLLKCGSAQAAKDAVKAQRILTQPAEAFIDKLFDPAATQ